MCTGTNVTTHTRDDTFGLLYWSCGNGWQLSNFNLTIKEAKDLRQQYEKKNILAKIILEIK